MSPSCCHFSAGPLCMKEKELHCPQGGFPRGSEQKNDTCFDVVLLCMRSLHKCHDPHSGAKGSSEGTPRYTKLLALKRTL